MNIGRTTIILFASKVIGSILGFTSTIYFARFLGAETLGIYSVIIALLAWLRMGGRIGITQAAIKRISEGEDQGEYFVASTVIISLLLFLLVGFVFLFQTNIENYVGEFANYSPIPVTWFINGILILYMISTPIKIILHGQGLVHIAGILNPIKIASQSLSQVLLVFLGYNLIGLLVGYGLGIIFIAFVGLIFVSIQLKKPSRHHFRSLISYAKYSWLSGLKSRAYNDVDIIVLGAFVPQALIGIYAVAWSITRFLDIFGITISQAMFPEISNVSTQNLKNATGLIEDSMAYAGFIVLPGFVGGVLLSDRLLRIYSSEFTQGTDVLWILLLSLLFYAYLQQHLNALNALDRPDLAFRANFAFIFTNIILNLILIWKFGWVGAAVASAASAGVGLLISYVSLKSILIIDYPIREIGKQGIAAIGMGIVVGVVQLIESTYNIVGHNLLATFILIGIGSTTYVLILSTISEMFRESVKRNVLVFN